MTKVRVHSFDGVWTAGATVGTSLQRAITSIHGMALLLFLNYLGQHLIGLGGREEVVFSLDLPLDVLHIVLRDQAPSSEVATLE